MDATWVLLFCWVGTFSEAEPDTLVAPFFQEEALLAIAKEMDWAAPGRHGGQYLSIWAARSMRKSTEDAPPSACARLLPDESFFRGQLEFARRHREWVEGQIPLVPPSARKGWEGWLREVDDRIVGYQAAYSASRMRDSFWLSTVRNDLKTVGKVFGEDAVRTGVLPPVVPLEFFRRIP